MVDRQMQILIVDDYSSMRGILRNLLRQLGFDNADEATDAKDALTKLKSKKYGLVISDWNMQPESGLDLLKKVRSDEALHRLPFIIVTAENRPATLMAAKEAGVSNFIIKPFNADMLKSKMCSVIGAF